MADQLGGMSEEYKVPANAPSWWRKIIGANEEDTPEHQFFKKGLGGGAQAAPAASSTTAPPSGGPPPEATPSAPPPSAPTPTPEAPTSKGAINSPEDIDRISQGVEEKSPTKPSLGKAMGGEASAASGKVGKALTSDKERNDSNSALMSGLLGWGLSTLLAPQWSRSASVYGGIQSGIESHNQYLAQREHETDKEREERLAQAKIGLEGAQAQHHLAAAKTAGNSDKIYLQMLKNQGKEDKYDLGRAIAEAPARMVQHQATQPGDIVKGTNRLQELQDTIKDATELARQNAIKTHQAQWNEFKGRLANGTGTFADLQRLNPDAVLAARSDANLAKNLRTAFAKNPAELAAFNQAMK